MKDVACEPCNGSGHVARAGYELTCPPCAGTGRVPWDLTVAQGMFCLAVILVAYCAFMVWAVTS